MKGNFKLSLMEKLAEEFSSNNINILLNEQYRMNKKIMNWSNEVFYENQLTAHSTVSDITLRDICPNLPEDHVLNNPIMMINMENVKDRSHEEFESHSFTNTDELNLVTEYVNRLVVDLGINPKAIAVISPYYAQVSTNLLIFKYLQCFRSKNYDDLSPSESMSIQLTHSKVTNVKWSFSVLSEIMMKVGRKIVTI